MTYRRASTQVSGQALQAKPSASAEAIRLSSTARCAASRRPLNETTFSNPYSARYLPMPLPRHQFDPLRSRLSVKAKTSTAAISVSSAMRTPPVIAPPAGCLPLSGNSTEAGGRITTVSGNVHTQKLYGVVAASQLSGESQSGHPLPLRADCREAPYRDFIRRPLDLAQPHLNAHARLNPPVDKGQQPSHRVRP